MDDSQFNRLLDLILEVKEELQETNTQLYKNTVMLVDNTVILNEHARRSTASELRIQSLEEEKRLKLIEVAYKAKMFRFIMVILGGIGTLAGIIEVIRNFRN